MNDSTTAEDKLLKIIKGDKLPQEPAQRKKENEISSSKKTLFTFRKLFTFGRLRKLMVVLVIISFVYLVGSFVYSWLGPDLVKLPAISKEENAPLDKPKLNNPDIKPYEYYSQGIKNKQVFGANALPASSAVSVNDLDSIKDISLVGIISSDPPQAMIEDKKNQKTYYLSKGQSIGDLQIEDIMDGKVILNYKGTHYELYL